jgi:hypothetical protein
METVPATNRPTGYDGDNHLGHEPNEALYFEDVKPTDPSLVNGFCLFAFGVLVSVLASNPLIATRAEGPAPIF